MERDHWYDDILHMKRPASPGHPPLSRDSRAAQFAPFAALSGYEDAIEEAARWTGSRLGPDEEGDLLLNEHLLALKPQIRRRPLIHITYFQQDAAKPGGEYVTRRARLKKMDEWEQWLQLEDGTRVAFSDLLEINALPEEDPAAAQEE